MRNTNALKHKLAILNPYHSVYKLCKDTVEEGSILVGVKNTEVIPFEMITILEARNYTLHTIDTCSFHGRAIDLQLINPITGRYMSGSSSGSAINVFLNINDIAIATDGGGSVLAPAVSLHLFGFISPLLMTNHVQRFQKQSTDGILFYPSLGFMCKDYSLLMKTIEIFLMNKELEHDVVIFKDTNEECSFPFPTTSISLLDSLSPRETLLPFLKDLLVNCTFLIVKEGPIDVYGFGDSIFGHFNETTKAIQKRANKGYLRVVNMANATAIVIPRKDLATGWLLICESKMSKIATMLRYVPSLVEEADPLVSCYFDNLSAYFEGGFKKG